jgi:Uma2 family endonuclease
MKSAAAARDDVAPREDATQVVRLDLSWAGYEGLVAALGDDSHVRLAYDGATLEIMSPGYTHEKIARFIAAILVYTLDEWGIDYEDVGSTTFRRKPVGGFEGDASFYVANAEKIRGLRDIDLLLHPAPDLILEVDISNRRLDKKAIYEACGVAEFWRYDDAEGVHVFALQDGAYTEIITSRVVRGLPIAVVNSLVERLRAGDKRPAIVSSIKQWLRDNRHLHDDGASV